MKLFLACLLISADAASLTGKPKIKTSKLLALRGGLDDKQVLLINAAASAAFGAEFGSSLLGSTWGSSRYWGDDSPTTAWQTLSDPFGIALLLLAKQTYDIAQEGDEATQRTYGKNMAFGWLAWYVCVARSRDARSHCHTRPRS